MRFGSALIPWVLAAACAAACAIDPPVVKRTGKAAPASTNQAARAKPPTDNLGSLTGAVKISASLLSTNGGGIISSNTAGLISNNAGGIISNGSVGLVSNNAGGIISNGSGGYRLLGGPAVYYSLKAEELVPVVKRRVVLLDSGRRRVRGVNPVETDAAGRFAFQDVPPGHNWIVEAQLDGFALTALGNAARGKDLEVTPTTTIVTEHLRTQLRDQADALQVMAFDAFQKLTQEVDQVVRQGGVRIDLSNQVRASQTFEQIVARKPTLAGTTSSIVVAAREDLAKVMDQGGIAPSLTDRIEEARPQSTLQANLTTVAERFASYVAGRKLGVARDIGRGSGVHLWNGLPVQWFYGGPDTSGHCVVAFGPNGPKLIRNDFYDHWLSAAQYWTLGAPLGDETEADESLTLDGKLHPGPLRRQSFENGTLSWTASSGLVMQVRGGQPEGQQARSGRLQYPPPGTSAVLVTTYLGAEAGDADGGPDKARFALPWGMAVDDEGNMFIGDNQNGHIRKIDPTGMVTTLLGPNKEPPLLPALSALVVAGPNLLYAVSDSRIVKVQPGKAVQVIAGSDEPGKEDGPGKAARFKLPRGLAISKDNRKLFVADSANDRIRTIDLSDPTFPVTTLAGGEGSGLKDGTAREAWFRHPHGIVVDPNNWVYVADSDNNAIRRISPTGEVVTLVGSTQRPDTQDGPATGPAEGQARFNRPMGLVMNPDGDLIVTEEGSTASSGGHVIRKVALGTGRTFTIAGVYRQGPPPGQVAAPEFQDGPGDVAKFAGPAGVTIDKDGQIFVADRDNNRIRKVVPSIRFEAVAGDSRPAPSAP